MRKYNKAHALRVPNNEGYRHTLRKRNAYCFSTATVITRKHLSVYLPVLDVMSRSKS